MRYTLLLFSETYDGEKNFTALFVSMIQGGIGKLGIICNSEAI